MYIVFARKCGEDFRGIWTNREGNDVILLEGNQILLQLDQLRFTKTSPRSAAIKKHQRLFSGPRSVVMHYPSGLIGQTEVG